MNQIIERIINSFDADTVIPRNQESPHQICLLNTTNIFGRSQPVVVEIQASRFDDNLKVLSLKTPLGNSDVANNLIQYYSLFEFPYEEEFLMVKMCLDQEQEGDFHVYMQVQLPVFTTEKGIELLSRYELNEAVKDLTECADLIERYATSDQDLTLETNTNERIDLKSKPLREYNFQDTLNKRWQVAFNKKYVYLNKESKEVKRNPIALWKLNHENQFVKYYSFHGNLIMSLTFFSKDLQLKEQNALEFHFDAVCNNKESEINLQTQ